MWLLAMLLSAFCLAVAPLSSSCEAWKRAKKTGDAFQDCVRHRPWCARKSAHCDQKLSRAEFYSCWNTGWPLSQEESREYQFETLASLAASNVSMRVVPFFVAIGGTDVDTKLVGTTGLCFDVDGSMCKSEPTLMPVLGQLSPEVLAATLKSRAAPVDFDILKIDVDSTDCPLLDAVIGAGFRPRVVVIEASPAWPPPLLFRREAADYTPSSMCPRARNKWLLTGCDHMCVERALVSSPTLHPFTPLYHPCHTRHGIACTERHGPPLRFSESTARALCSPVRAQWRVLLRLLPSGGVRGPPPAWVPSATVCHGGCHADPP